MKKQNHTPTPWKELAGMNSGLDSGIFSIREWDEKYRGEEDSEQAIAESEANAAFIVRAVNSHEALLSALKRMLQFSDGRMATGSRLLAESMLADEISDLIEQVEGK